MYSSDMLGRFSETCKKCRLQLTHYKGISCNNVFAKKYQVYKIKKYIKGEICDINGEINRNAHNIFVVKL